MQTSCSALVSILPVVALWCATQCQTAQAASLFWFDDLKAIALDGAIRSGDLEAAVKLVEAHPETRGVYLNSPGGDFIEAIQIGEWVRQRGFATYASTLCMSACAYVWLGGTARRANGVVYIHLPFFRTSTATVEIPTEGATLAGWYLSQIGSARNLVEAMVAVGSTEGDPMFPITGPNTALLKVDYAQFGDEKLYRDALTQARASR